MSFVERSTILHHYLRVSSSEVPLYFVYLCFVFAASAFKGLLLHVGYSDESTEVTHIDLVGIRGGVEALMKKLCCSVSNLTVSLHFTKSKTTVSV